MTQANEYADLQARCRKLLDELRFPRPYSLDCIVRWVEDLRSRPLILKALPQQMAHAGACGLWLGTDEADFVFYEARTVPVHRQHIILHEIAHMLARHQGQRGDAESSSEGDGIARPPGSQNIDGGTGRGWEHLLGGLEPHLIRRLMMRTSYTTAEEREAEMLASLMRCRPSPLEEGALGRLQALFGMRADDRY